ncbi:MAG: LamG domain-containing protein, partial [Candidatus Cloacimonadaceae bacterium]|nr:LamG domain-containing protein [Candidatus Cloacimonadaceae bacterium]
MKLRIFVLVLFVLALSAVYAQGNVNAVYFDGVNDCVAVGNMQSQITTTYTAEAWIKPASIAIGTGDIATYGRTIFASSTTSDKPLWVSLRGSEIWVRTFTSNDPVGTTSGAGITANTWYHIAVTAVRGGLTKLYINGAEVFSVNSGNLYVWNSIFTIGDLRPNRLLPFHGLIDEVRVWNVVRTPAQILANMSIPISPSSTGLVGYWKFDEASGTTAVDSTPPTTNGTLTNGAYFTPSDLTLPIELSSFTAVPHAQNYVVLHWVTQSETDVMGYYIYRNTINDISSAIRVSPLIAATNSSSQTSYEYEDNEVTPGQWYYWLQNI